MSLIKNQAVAAAIAEFLADGIEHPGDPETKMKPTKLNIPMFRVLGKPPPYSDAAKEANRTIGEAVVYLIEAKLNSSIIENTEIAKWEEAIRETTAKIKDLETKLAEELEATLAAESDEH